MGTHHLKVAATRGARHNVRLRPHIIDDWPLHPGDQKVRALRVDLRPREDKILISHEKCEMQPYLVGQEALREQRCNRGAIEKLGLLHWP